jgi:amino acid permease
MEESFTLLSHNSGGFHSRQKSYDPDLSWLESLLNWMGLGTTESINNSILSSVFLLLNNMIGAGFLVQPYVFKESGIFLATIVYICLATATFMGTQLLIAIADYSGRYDFSVIVLNALGPIGAISLDFCVVIFNIGAILTYTLMLGSLSQDLILEFLHYTNDDIIPWYISEPIFTLFWSFLIIYPCSLARKYGQLTIIAYFSIMMVLVSVILVCIEGPYFYLKLHTNETANWWSFEGLSKSLGSIVFALGFAPAVLHTYGSANSDCKFHFQTIALITIIIGATICYVTGLVGYMTFKSSTDSDILENFTGHVAFLCKTGVLLHFNFLIPGYFVVMRASMYHLQQLIWSMPLWWISTNRSSIDKLQQMMHQQRQSYSYFELEDVSEQSSFRFFSITTFLLFAITTLACLVEIFFGHKNAVLNLIVDITGGVAGSFIFFIFPSLCGIQELRTNSYFYRQSWCILIVGIVVAIVVTVGTFLKE